MMITFGKGQYELTTLLDKYRGKHYPLGRSRAAIISLLSQPPLDDIQYLAKAIIYRSALQLSEARDQVDHWVGATVTRPARKETVKSVLRNGVDYHRLDLNQVAQIPGMVHEIVDASGHRIAVVLVSYNEVENCNEVTVIADEPIIITGAAAVPMLTVQSQASVYLDDKLHIKNQLHIQAPIVEMGSSFFLETKKVRLHCEKNTRLAGELCADDVQIQTGNYDGKATITANTITVIAETADHYATLRARESIKAIGLKWTNHKGSIVQGLKSVKYIADRLEDASLLITESLIAHAMSAVYKGTYYVEKCLQLLSQTHIEAVETSQFICGGDVTQSSRIATCLKGKLVHSPKLKVGWDCVVDPTRHFEKNHAVSSRGQHVRFVPRDYRATSVDHSYALKMRDTMKPISTVSIHGGLYVGLLGKIQLEDAVLKVTSHHLIELMGELAIMGSSSAYPTYFKADQLNLGGKVNTNQAMQIDLAENLVHTGDLQGAALQVKAKNYQFESGAKQCVQSLQLDIKEDITLQENTHFQVTETAVMRCDTFRNHTAVESSKAIIEARSSIINYGRFFGEDLYLISPFVISFGGMSATRINVISYFNFLAGINKASVFTSSSIISIAPGLFVQSVIQPPSASTLAMTIFNIAATVVDYAVPIAAPITNIVRFSVNGVAQSRSVYSQLARTTQSMDGLRDSNSINTMKFVTTLMQTMLMPYGIVTSTLGSVSHLAPVSVGSVVTQPPLLPMLQSVASNCLLSFSGSNSVSLVAINSGLVVGVSSSTNALFSANLGATFGVTQTNNSLINVDSGIAGTLGPSSSSGLWCISMGTSIPVVGQHTLRYENVTLQPWIPAPYYHQAIDAGNLTLLSSVQFDHSSISARELHQGDKLTLTSSQFHIEHEALRGAEVLDIENSQGSISQLEIEEKSTLSCQASQASVGKLSNHGTVNADSSQLSIGENNNDGQFIASRSNMASDKTNNTGKMQLIGVSGSLGEVKNANGGMLALDGSTLKADSLTNDSQASMGMRSSTLEAKSVTNTGLLVLNNSRLASQALDSRGRLQLDNSVVEANQTNMNASNTTAHGSHIYTLNSQPTPISGVDVLHRQATDDEIKTFNESQPKLCYYENKIYYRSDTTLNIDGWTIVSVVPVGYCADNINVTNGVISTSEFNLYADQNLNVFLAQVNINGNSYWYAKNDINVVDSQMNVAGALHSHSDGKTHYLGSSAIAKEADIQGDGGVLLEARVVEHRTERTYWQWHGIHSGRVHKVEITTEVTPTTIVATQGAVSVRSSGGSVVTHGAIMVGGKIYIDAKDSVKLQDVVGQNTCQKDTYSLCGHEREKDRDDTSTESILYSQSDIEINAHQNDISLRSAVLEAQTGTVSLHAGTSVDCTRSVLNHERTRSVQGVTYANGPALPGETIYQSLKHHLNQLAESKSLDQGVSQFTQLAVESTNLINTAISVAREASPVNALLGVMAPSIGVGLGVSHSNEQFQSLGSGGIHAKNLHVEAKRDAEFNNAFEIKAETVSLTADHVTFSGAILHSSSQHSDANLDFTLTPTQVSVGGSVHSANASQNATVMATPEIKSMEIHARRLDINDATLSVQKLSGSVDEIHANTTVNEARFDSFSASVSQQSASMQHQHCYAESLPMQSELRATDASDFHAKSVQSKDAIISPSIHAEHRSEEVSSLHRRESQFAVSGSTSNVMGALSIESKHRNDNHSGGFSATIPIANLQGLENFKNKLHSRPSTAQRESKSTATSQTLPKGSLKSSAVSGVSAPSKNQGAHASPSQQHHSSKHAHRSHTATAIKVVDVDKEATHIVAAKEHGKASRYKAELRQLSKSGPKESKAAVSYLKDKTQQKLAKAESRVQAAHRAGKGLAALSVGLNVAHVFSPENKGHEVKAAQETGLEMVCSDMTMSAGAAMLPGFPIGTVVGTGLMAFGLFACESTAKATMHAVDESAERGVSPLIGNLPF